MASLRQDEVQLHMKVKATHGRHNGIKKKKRRQHQQQQQQMPCTSLLTSYRELFKICLRCWKIGRQCSTVHRCIRHPSTADYPAAVANSTPGECEPRPNSWDP